MIAAKASRTAKYASLYFTLDNMESNARQDVFVHVSIQKGQKSALPQSQVSCITMTYT